MQEKRKSPRKPLDCALKVCDVNSDYTIGCVVDLSEDGFMLLSHEAFDSGSVLQLRLELPAEVNGQRVIELGAENLWCSAANTAQHFWAGFRIIDASELAMATLTLVIRNSDALN